MEQSRWGLAVWGRRRRGLQTPLQKEDGEKPPHPSSLHAPTAVAPVGGLRAGLSLLSPSPSPGQGTAGTSRPLPPRQAVSPSLVGPPGMRAGPRVPPCARSTEQGRHRAATSLPGAGGASYGPSQPTPAPSAPQGLMEAPLEGSGPELSTLGVLLGGQWS